MSGAADIDLLTTSRTHNIIYALIVGKLATYAEIRDAYDIHEVLDLYEIYVVSAYNQNQIHESKQIKR